MGMNLALGLFTTGVGISSAGLQSKHDKDMVSLEYKSDLEDIRRREFEQEQIKGVAKAFSENAGVKHTSGSTAQGYLDTMNYQFKKELDFMKAYAEEARQLGNEAAGLRKFSNILNSISGGLSMFGDKS